ncbi:hypothetical protein QBC46DRAFT_363829 [Diplogelasinospora grovesii]|uniref:Esterase-like protein n=1 Tax=Diplogelasinospora grovesii TaxID=303347 RepID=A0AAN6NBP7_9PEZI|nr:hypothetical protein QBC46DRAFT_363829 [Diplogelasinospora grovesii]
MDPAFHDARERFTKPKGPEPPVYQKTKFQRLLARNPYAQALATPIRRCPATGVHLPKHFLQGFRFMSHPETGRPYWVPQGLEKKQSQTTAMEGTTDNGERDTAPATAEGELAANARTPLGPTGYFLSSQKLLKGFLTPGSPYFGREKSLLQMNRSSAERLRSVLRKVVWRDGMDAFILDLTRRRIVEGLVEFSELVEKAGRKYLIKCESWDDAKQYKHRGCLLYLGSSDSAQDAVGAPPAQLSTMTIPDVRFGGKLAVHDLAVLLGDEHLNRLRQESPLLRDGSLFLLGRQRTLDLQLLLWKLQGYIALR